jgi:hypothetical protein
MLVPYFANVFPTYEAWEYLLHALEQTEDHLSNRPYAAA